jgi:hypothetical protein
VRSTIEVVVIRDEWDQFGECGEYLANCLELRDHFVINVEEGNIKSVDFYLFFVHKLYILWKRISHVNGGLHSRQVM